MSTAMIVLNRAERRAFKRRENRTEQMFRRMASSTARESERLARVLWREVRVPRPAKSRQAGTNGREHRSRPARRTASSSTTSSSDPGDSEPPRQGELRHVGHALAELLEHLGVEQFGGAR